MLWNVPSLLADGGVDLSDFIEAAVALLVIIGGALGGIASRRRGKTPEVFEGEAVEDDAPDTRRQAPVRPAMRPTAERPLPPRGAPARPVPPPSQAPRPVAPGPFGRSMESRTPQRPRPVVAPAQRAERRVIIQQASPPRVAALGMPQPGLADDDHETRHLLGAELPSELAAHKAPAAPRVPAPESAPRRTRLPIDPKRPARTAIILSEIFGPPRSVRGWDE